MTMWVLKAAFEHNPPQWVCEWPKKPTRAQIHAAINVKDEVVTAILDGIELDRTKKQDRMWFLLTEE